MSDKILMQVDIFPHPIGDHAGSTLGLRVSGCEFEDTSLEEAENYVVRRVKFKRPALLFYVDPDDIFFFCGKIIQPGPDLTECLTFVELIPYQPENADGGLANNDEPRKQEYCTEIRFTLFPKNYQPKRFHEFFWSEKNKGAKESKWEKIVRQIFQRRNKFGEPAQVHK